VLFIAVDDPNEWNNLAGDPQFADVIASHRKWLPKPEAKQVPDLEKRKAKIEASR
jgi:choline-sulfatase